MKSAFPIALLAIAYSMTAGAQVRDVEMQVLAASETRMTAVLRADEDTLKRIQDDDFVLVQDGLILNKAAQIARVMNYGRPENSASLDIDVHNLSLEGRVAIMTGVTTVTSNGNAFSTAFTEVWVRRGNNWFAKAAHYSAQSMPPQ